MVKLNLTKYMATEDQEIEGVIEPYDKELVRALLTFKALPEQNSIDLVARSLAGIAERAEVKFAMIDCEPFLVGPLVRELKLRGIVPLYSMDTPSKDNPKELEHKGFIPVM